MNHINPNKKKIINDPVHGFITIPSTLIYNIIEHPYFQRLRHIKQLGLTYLVYPGAVHSRFQHVLGAMYLMGTAISTLRSKGVDISQSEAEAVQIAILLHDMGHGPFSHVFENVIVSGINHEEISLVFMNKLNEEFEGKLTLAIQIFKGEYQKNFLHQLVSSQLDMDRLDYLKRDSFYSGVSEGVIGSDRIIKMLTVVDDQLMVESKGIYSIEKFLVARRLMYWQVYLHKTAISAEQMLVKIAQRARFLAHADKLNFTPDALLFFLKTDVTKAQFVADETIFNRFASIDDNDVTMAIKSWSKSDDVILSTLASNLMNRKLLKIIVQKEPFEESFVQEKITETAQKMSITHQEAKEYFVLQDEIKNNAYKIDDDKINIIYNNGEIKDISEASDLLNLSVLGKTVKKHTLCFPK